jgi:hypothetical protein
MRSKKSYSHLSIKNGRYEKKGDNPMTQINAEIAVNGNNRLFLLFKDHCSGLICSFKSILPQNFFYLEFLMGLLIASISRELHKS